MGAAAKLRFWAKNLNEKDKKKWGPQIILAGLLMTVDRSLSRPIFVDLISTFFFLLIVPHFIIN